MNSHIARVLLDECLPQDLRHEFDHSEYDVQTAAFAGVAGLSNGALLAAIGDRFDVFVTIDSSLPDQQDVVGRSYSLVILRAPTNRLKDLLPLVPALKHQFKNAQPGAVYFVPGE